MALAPPQPTLLSHLPPEDAFVRALQVPDFSDSDGQQALLAARKALGSLTALRQLVRSKPEEYFSLDHADPTCVPKPIPFPPYPNRRLRTRQASSFQEASSSLSIRPPPARPVLIPSTPAGNDFDPDEVYNSEDNLRAHLAKSNETPSYLGNGIVLELSSFEPSAKRVQLNVTLGKSGTGHIKLAMRRRSSRRTDRADAGGTAEIGRDGDGAGAAVIALEMVVIRANMHASNEQNKGKNDLSSYRSYVELCTHLTSLQLTLPELLHRLPAYLDLPLLPCAACGKVLRKGIFPAGRAWRPKTLSLDYAKQVDGQTELTGMNGTASGDGVKLPRNEDVNMDNAIEEKQASRAEAAAVGEWIAFHLDCWPKLDQ